MQYWIVVGSPLLRLQIYQVHFTTVHEILQLSFLQQEPSIFKWVKRVDHIYLIVLHCLVVLSSCINCYKFWRFHRTVRVAISLFPKVFKEKIRTKYDTKFLLKSHLLMYSDTHNGDLKRCLRWFNCRFKNWLKQDGWFLFARVFFSFLATFHSNHL